MITDQEKKLIDELLNYKPEEGDSTDYFRYTIKQLQEEINKSKKLFCYSKPGVMEHHNYTDDVALCYAQDENEAYEIFLQLYDIELLKGNIKEVSFNSYGVFIATDY